MRFLVVSTFGSVIGALLFIDPFSMTREDSLVNILTFFVSSGTSFNVSIVPFQIDLALIVY